mgnify:CR=1 FL=1
MGTNDIIKNHSNCNIKPISNCKTPSEISEIWNNNINALIDKFPNSTITVVLNDNINKSPYLQKLLSSGKIVTYLKFNEPCFFYQIMNLIEIS